MLRSKNQTPTTDERSLRTRLPAAALAFAVGSTLLLTGCDKPDYVVGTGGTSVTAYERQGNELVQGGTTEPLPMNTYLTGACGVKTVVEQSATSNNTETYTYVGGVSPSGEEVFVVAAGVRIYNEANTPATPVSIDVLTTCS